MIVNAVKTPRGQKRRVIVRSRVLLSTRLRGETRQRSYPMNFTLYAKKLGDLKYFIEKGRIKTPKDISKKLGVTERTALRLIAFLKDAGTEVNFAENKKGTK